METDKTFNESPLDSAFRKVMIVMIVLAITTAMSIPIALGFSNAY